MRELLADILELVRQVYNSWVALVSGAVSVLFSFLAWGNIMDAPFGTIALVALLVAMFAVWRNMKREARPYTVERFNMARDEWNRLSAEQRALLLRLLIAGNLPVGECVTLESCTFYDRDFRGRGRIFPEFIQLIGRFSKDSENVPQPSESEPPPS